MLKSCVFSVRCFFFLIFFYFIKKQHNQEEVCKPWRILEFLVCERVMNLDRLVTSLCHVKFKPHILSFCAIIPMTDDININKMCHVATAHQVCC